jgi:MFS family permease
METPMATEAADARAARHEATGQRDAAGAEGHAPPRQAGRGGSFALLATVQTTLIFTITMMAVPLPGIGAEFGLDRSELVVVSAAYGLSFSGLLLFGGRLADRFGGRPVFVAGLAVFAAASTAVPAAPGFGVLAVSRFGQGIGAALVAPAAMVLLRAIIPEPDRYGRAMTTWGGLSVLGATTGIVLSGLVAAAVSWRWIFAVPLFVAGLGLLLTPALLPASRPATPVALDAPGAVLATSGITLLSYGLVMTGDHSWSSATAGVPVAAGFILLAAFAVREARTRSPLLPPSFLADRRRAAALAVIGLSAAATAVVCLFLTLYLQQIRGWTTLRTSLAFVPYALALIVVGRVAGRLVARFGAPRVVVAGLALAAAGLFLLTPLNLNTAYHSGVLPGLLALPAGVALTFAAAAVLIVADVPRPQIGLAAGVMNTAIELGPTVGLAIINAVAIGRTHRNSSSGDLPRAVTDGYAWGFAATGFALALLAVLVAMAVVPRRRDNA